MEEYLDKDCVSRRTASKWCRGIKTGTCIGDGGGRPGTESLEKDDDVQ